MLERLKSLIDNPQRGILVGFLLALIPLAKFFAVVLLVLMLLRRGDKYAQLGYMLIAVAVGFAYNRYQLDNLGGSLWAIGLFFIPLWVMTMVLRQLRSLTLSLESGTLLMMLMVTVTWFIYGDLPANNLMLYMHAQGVDTTANGEIPAPVLAKIFLILWPLFLGLLQVWVLLLARWVQSDLYYPGGFRSDFHQLRLHKAVALGAILMTALTLLMGPEQSILLYQLEPLASLLLLLAGLGLVHWYATFKGFKSFWLGGVYLIVFLVPQFAGLVLGVNALVDSFFNIRQRVIAAKQRGA